MERIGVMHLVDTLELGGAEKVAVDLVNHLPRDRYVPYLCTTRRDGPLEDALLADVGRLRLNRRHTLDGKAFWRLRRFLAAHEIRIVHAHGSTLFLASAATALRSRTALVWHTHYGRFAVENRRALAWRVAVKGAHGVIAVNDNLAAWCRTRLAVSPERVCYVPNPVCAGSAAESPELRGTPGFRAVCVANFRPEKDHRTLIAAMALVSRQVPAAHLILIGGATDAACLAAARRQVVELGLEASVTFLGPRSDVAAILRQCDVGVLSSITEGLPVSLLEYGVAGLAPVATAVGQCPEVLAYGKAGVLASAGSEKELAAGITGLLEHPDRRSALAAAFRARVNEHHSPERVVGRVCEIYDRVLLETGGPAPVGPRTTPAEARI